MDVWVITSPLLCLSNRNSVGVKMGGQDNDANYSCLECKNSKQCHPAKHHYDECVERVTAQIDNDGKAKEDCVEECKPIFSSKHIEKL